jgi:hypothetical protein
VAFWVIGSLGSRSGAARLSFQGNRSWFFAVVRQMQELHEDTA